MQTAMLIDLRLKVERRICMTREGLLSELIDTILVHDINLEKKSQMLIRKNGITTSCNYGSLEQMKKIQRIFEICFHIDDKDYKKYFPADKLKLRKEVIIEKALLYFKKREIDYVVLIQPYCQNSEEFERYLLYAICHYLIPVSFCILKTETEKKPNKYDDITVQYHDALRSIKIMLEQFQLRYLMQSTIPTQEIVDRTYIHRELCNYKIPLQISELSLQLPFIPSWEPDYVSIYKGLDKKKDFAKKFQQKMQEKNEFDLLVEGFIPISSDSNEESIQIESLISESDSYQYPLVSSSMFFDQFYALSYSYYTKLNKTIIIEKYPDVHSHEELKQAIAAKASKDICAYYENQIKIKYHEIMHYINAVLNGIMNIDLCELLNMNPTDKALCEAALSAFAIPSDDVFYTIEKYSKNQTEMLLQAYHSLQGGLSSFLNHINISGLHFAYQFTEILKGEDLTEHIEIVKRFLSSDELANAVSIQEEKSDENGEKHIAEKSSKQTEYEPYEVTESNHRYNSLFIGMKNAFSKYYQQLLNPNPDVDPFHENSCKDVHLEDPDYPQINPDNLSFFK